MSFIDQISASARGRPMTLIVAAGVVIFALLAVGYGVFLQNPYQVLFDKLRPMDAATIVAELDRKKTPYKLEDGGARILVPAKIVDSTRLALMSGDLPLKGTVGFELFNKSDMGLTEFAQKINYQRALQGELQRTIMALDMVESARVHLSLPEPSIFRDDHRPPKASVTLTMQDGKRLAPEMVLGIQHLVAASTPDLETENVYVLNEQGEVVSRNLAPGAADQALGVEASVDRYYEDKIRRAVSRLYPDADLSISVRAALGEVRAPVVIPSPAGSGAAADTDDAPSSGVATTKPEPADLQTQLQQWTPASRDFALHTTVSVAAPISPRLQEEIRSLAAEAVGLDPSKGDQILLQTSVSGVDPRDPLLDAQAKTLNADPGASPPTPAKASAAILQGKASLWQVALVLALLGLAGLAWLVGQARRAQRRLSAEERVHYVGRLKHLLEQEDNHVASVS